MRTRFLSFIALALIMSALIILLGGTELVGAGENEYTIGGDAYTIGSVSVDPRNAYIGDSVNLTGTGHIANADLVVTISAIFEEDGESYYAFLGNTTSDSAGNWAFTFQVPATLTRESDGAEVDTFAADWPVGGTTVQDDAYYDSYNYLNVLGVYVAPVQAATTTTTTTPQMLPSTGAAISHVLITSLMLLLAGHLCLSAAVIIRV